jgi:hypothetical protein
VLKVVIRCILLQKAGDTGDTGDTLISLGFLARSRGDTVGTHGERPPTDLDGKLPGQCDA